MGRNKKKANRMGRDNRGGDGAKEIGARQKVGEENGARLQEGGEGVGN